MSNQALQKLQALHLKNTTTKMFLEVIRKSFVSFRHCQQLIEKEFEIILNEGGNHKLPDDF